MTFNPLPGDGQPVFDYAEDGIQFQGHFPDRWFYRTINWVDTNTGALVRSEAIPLRISLVSGGAFDLDSVQVWTNVNNAFFLFRSSSGGEQSLNAIGTTSFGAGFHNVTYVDIVSATDPVSQIGLDNIRVTPFVPEPTSLVIPSGMLSVVLSSRRTISGRGISVRRCQKR